MLPLPRQSQSTDTSMWSSTTLGILSLALSKKTRMLPVQTILHPSDPPPSSPEQTYEQFNTNVFGGLNVARAFLPYMRPRKTGTIVWIGSLGGYRSVDCTVDGLSKITRHPSLTEVIAEQDSTAPPSIPSGVSPRPSTRKSLPWDFVA